jgi:acetyl-CoA decarbonylase/synthase, CODH/ACS complex subunit gamma
MALSGLEIYKLLPGGIKPPHPKANCKECGYPTCLAFAMKLAAKQTELSLCKYVSDEAKGKLEASAAPPIRLVALSAGDRKVQAGNEIVLFRHEKTFFNRPGLFVRVKDTLPAAEMKALVDAVAAYEVDYVGIKLRMDGLAVEAASGDAAKFAEAVKVAAAVKMPLILIAKDKALMEAGLNAAAPIVPLLYAADESNWQAMSELAKAKKAPLALKGKGDLQALANLANQVKGAGLEDLVLDPGTRGFSDSLQIATQMRRLAIKANQRACGFPLITFPGEGPDAALEAPLAAQYVAKYGGFVVLDRFSPALVYPLLVLRQNIYTDPQKPIQVQPGIYEINSPKPDSPVMMTTNFSITYFAVANEIEGSGIPAWLLIADAEGMSVLTAWAAGKFDADKIVKTIKTTNIESKISHKKIVIPGAVAVLSGEVEGEMPGWSIMVGPREAVDIPSYYKNVWKSA